MMNHKDSVQAMITVAKYIPTPNHRPIKFIMGTTKVLWIGSRPSK